MGILDDWFGIDSGTDPMTMYLMQQRMDEQRRKDEQARLDKKEAEQKASLAALRTNASGAARTSAQNYFSGQGLDPTQYQGDIDAKINEILATTSEDDPNVGSYFTDLGDTIYQNRQNAARSQAGRSVDSLFGPEFERSRIGNTLDDSILADIESGARGKADTYVENLFKRGVINDTGRNAARSNLDEQGAGVRSILNTLGSDSLAAGRQSLSDIANRARTGAQTLRLGNNFDPSTFGGEADSAFNDFLAGLNDSIRSKAPTNLFDTSGLSAIAGAGQGAQNFKFDPRALAGIIDEENPEGDPTQTQKKRVAF